MKKFLAILLTVIIVVGGISAIIFLTNDKFMFYGMSESWKYISAKMDTAFQNSSNSDYYDFTVSSFDDTTDTTKTFQVKIKKESTGFIAYASVVEKVGDAESTTIEYYKGETTSLGVKGSDSSTGTIINNTIANFLNYVDSDLNNYLNNLNWFIHTEDYTDLELLMMSAIFDSSRMVFSFSPFYMGVAIDFKSTDEINEIKIDNSNNAREIYNYSTAEGDGSYYKVLNNNVGKQISVPEYTPVA